MMPPGAKQSMQVACALALAVGLSTLACCKAHPKPAPPSPNQPPVPTRTDPPPPVPTPPTPEASKVREIFPHVRIDTEQGYVEFDGIVPIDAHDPAKPRIYLEVLACTPDTKEHESLVMTPALPSHIHAALLLLNLEPGTPGQWDWNDNALHATPPTGPALTVTVRYTASDRDTTDNLAEWVLDATSRATLAASAPQANFLFAGSQIYKRQGAEHYRADVEGTLIGLTTFGGEAIAWGIMYNPDSGIEEPRWIANPARVPAFNTHVVVRLMHKP